MKLGEHILKLRKEKGFSQEQLGEKIQVTRQTVSNWELGETSPNPEQLKKLSKVLNISIDELLENETKEALMKKVSNTEKLAGMTIKILKVLGILIIIYFIFVAIAIVGLSIYSVKKQTRVEKRVETVCKIDKKSYEIEMNTGKNQSFQCNNCSKEMLEELKKNVDYDNMETSMEHVEEYFKNHNGTCE